MKAILKSIISHETNDNECYGCWDIIVEEGVDWAITAVCNECGEVRELGKKELSQ